MKVAEMTGGCPARCGECPFAVRERELGLNEQCVAGIGEFNWAPGPVDQFHSELAFQLLNLLTQRRLGDVESLRGAAEVATVTK
jgi:hypothetical protein